MSTSYEKVGRTRQKQRTRDALVSATRHLIEQGEIAPTVEQAAEYASVSRTTAYRYFSSQDALLVAAHPEITAVSLLPDVASEGSDPQARFAKAVGAFVDMVVDTEPQLRAMLRVSLEPGSKDLPLRQGRAIGWFEDGMEGLPLAAPERRRLAQAVRSAVGIESLIWLTDVGGLSRPEAAATMRWSAQALLRTALAEGPPPIS
ncbi:MAG: TetR/AcrR family transcriptional regulator [Nocardioidaceae bacterium]